MKQTKSFKKLALLLAIFMVVAVSVIAFTACDEPNKPGDGSNNGTGNVVGGNQSGSDQNGSNQGSNGNDASGDNTGSGAEFNGIIKYSDIQNTFNKMLAYAASESAKSEAQNLDISLRFYFSHPQYKGEKCYVEMTDKKGFLGYLSVYLGYSGPGITGGGKYCDVVFFDTAENAAAGYGFWEGDNVNISRKENTLIVESTAGLFNEINSSSLQSNEFTPSQLNAIIDMMKKGVEGNIGESTGSLFKDENGWTFYENLWQKTGNCLTEYKFSTDLTGEVAEECEQEAVKIGTEYSADSFFSKNSDYCIGAFKPKTGMRFEENDEGTGYILTDYYFEDEILAVSVPRTYNSKPVVKIGDNAFNNCIGIRYVTVPDTVTEIGSNAFCFMPDLVSITIPKSVTKISYELIYFSSGFIKYEGTVDDWNRIDKPSGSHHDPTEYVVKCTDGNVIY